MVSFKFIFIFVLLFIQNYCEWKFDLRGYNNLRLSKHFVISTSIAEQNSSRMLIDELKHGLHFNITLNAKKVVQIFIQTKTDRLNRKTEYIIFENDRNKTLLQYPNNLVEGFVIEDKYTSYVIGYLEDIYFYGKIVIINRIIYIENLKKYIDIFPEYYNTSYNAIAFERNYSPEELEGISKARHLESLESVHDSLRNISKRMVRTGKLCSLLILIDYSFLNIIHHMNVDSAVNHVLMTIEEANSLFRSTDFDGNGYPDNIGFYIKYCTVFKTPHNNLLPQYSTKPIEAKLFVKMFSKFYLLRDVCLGVVFTGQSFKDNVLGISYSPNPAKSWMFGGICDQSFPYSFGLHLNSLAVSARSNNGKNLLDFIFNLSVCHELGHSFGADHDSTPKCDGYLMSPQTPLDQNRKHFIFSSCSKRDILLTIKHKGQCFEDDHDAYCGNYIKEKTEECDCGTIRDCWEFDKCCIPHGRPNACSINRERGYTCHPSQGLCCTAQCQYANLKSFGLECRNFQDVCPCKKNQKVCTCGVHGYCSGNKCHSEECTRIGLEECSCPKNLNKTNCRICCFSKTNPKLKCALSNEISRRVIDVDKGMLQYLKKQKNQSDLYTVKYGFYEKYCNEDECIQLYFRSVKFGEFCTLFGKLGKCSIDNVCEIRDTTFLYTGTFDKGLPRSVGTIQRCSGLNALFIFFMAKYIMLNL